MQIQQRKALVKIALLAFGWPLALNHFYDGNTAGGVGALLLTWLAWVTIIGVIFWIFPYFQALFGALRAFEGSDD
ncbi:hypothetical protein SynRS9907_01349 [Synechococcus sp. RS9907]|uniref:hypothetical protein n=1 Tax=Synechococcus sp. RS9907 TaxID=221350 RepID=UPI001860CBBC|nr:hypothetical protein [Synechococcus sp. RS9907]QNI82193.1 hypothetical protein SynRS9907_01349 [Synechococcus sp. RS9907]